MKLFILCAVWLLIGLTTGWYFEQRRAKAEMTSAVDIALSGEESSRTVQAARAAKVIALVESGDTQEAVRTLAAPIADYYLQYRSVADNQNRLKMSEILEELIRTNMIVARVVKERMALSMPTNEAEKPTRTSITPKGSR